MSNPEQLNENLADATESEPRNGSSLEIAKTDALKIVDQADQISQAIESDSPINQEAVDRLDEALSKTKVILFGDEMTVQEIKDIPDREINFELYEKIATGRNFEESELWQLTYLTPPMAKRLVARMSSNRFSMLSLDGLKSMSQEVAKEINKHKGGLSIRSVEKMDIDTIQELFNRPNRRQIQFGLSTLSKEQASVIKDYEGTVGLINLDDIDLEAAQELSGFKGSALWLGLKKLSPEIAEQLAKFIKKKPDEDWWTKKLSFKYITEISPEVAEKFAHCTQNLEFRDVSEISLETAQRFKDFSGGLNFDGFKKIDYEIAKALSETKAELSFLQIEEISVQALQYFTNRQRKVNLPGLMSNNLTGEHLQIIANSTNILVRSDIKELANVQNTK